MNPYKIFIVNFFGTRNKGDIAILIGMMETFKKISNKCVISVMSHHPELTSAYLNEYNPTIIKSVINNKDKQHIIQWLLNIVIWQIQVSSWLLFKKIGVDIKFLFNKKVRNILKEYDEADIIVSCGGGYIHDNQGPIILLALHYLFIGTSLKKKVILYSQSIGPINSKLYRYITKYVLNKTSLILVREDISRNLLNEIGIKIPVITTSDAAFVYPPINNKKIENIMYIENINKDKILVGITVRNWHFPNSTGNVKLKFEQYKTTIAQVADYCIDKLDAHIIFFPMVEIPKEDERVLAKSIIEKMKSKHKTKIIENDYLPSELRGLMGKLDLLIGTRFHSVIFALSMNVPVISIMYEHKSMGIMKMMNLEDFVHDINSLNTYELIHSVNTVMNNHKKIIDFIKNEIKSLNNIVSLNANLMKLELHQR